MPISYSVYGIESFVINIETSENSGGFCLVSSGICNGLTDDLLFLGGQIFGLDSALLQAQDAQCAQNDHDDHCEHSIVEGQILEQVVGNYTGILMLRCAHCSGYFLGSVRQARFM